MGEGTAEPWRMERGLVRCGAECRRLRRHTGGHGGALGESDVPVAFGGLDEGCAPAQRKTTKTSFLPAFVSRVCGPLFMPLGKGEKRFDLMGGGGIIDFPLCVGGSFARYGDEEEYATMRRTILAMVVALTVCAVRAVTFNWDKAAPLDLTRDNATGAYSATGFSIDGSKDFAVKVALTFNAPGDASWFNGNGLGSAKALLTLGTQSDRQIFTAFRNQSTTTVWSRGAGSHTPADATMISVKSGTYDLVFAYDATANQMQITYDGDILATVTGDLLPTDGFGTLTELTVAGVPNASGGFNENWSAVSNPRSWSVASVQVLPEPTALALLALGVVGVALRRRVA